MDASYRFCGQPLNQAELKLIVDVARRYPRLSRNELAHTVCELLDWHRPNGGLKTAECRRLLEQMNERALIGLPTLRQGRPRGAATVIAVAEGPVTATLSGALEALHDLTRA